MYVHKYSSMSLTLQEGYQLQIKLQKTAFVVLLLMRARKKVIVVSILSRKKIICIQV